MNSLTSSHPQTENAVTIIVTEVIGDTLCIACEDGQKVYEQIAAAFKEGKCVTIDFKNVEETVPACMDTMIGQLYEHFPEEQIEASLSIVNANSDAADDIRNAIYWTKEYLKDPQRFREAARELMGDEDE